MAKQAKEISTERRGLIPWRPFPEMARWERDMERMLGSFFTDDRWRLAKGLGMHEPSIDLYEEKDQIVVKAELPGMTKDDIQLSIAANVLTLKGEKKKEEEDKGKDYYRSERVYGAFMRALPLPAEIDPEKVHATFKNGVLEIRLPKSEEAKKREIKVKVES
jgi:HSP20 family protein